MIKADAVVPSGLEEIELDDRTAVNDGLLRKNSLDLAAGDGDDFDIDTEDVLPPPKANIFASRGVQLYLLAMLCGSVMKMTSKLLVEQMDPFFLVLVRMSITSVVAIGYMLIRRIPHLFWGPPGVRIMLSVRGFLGFVNICMTYYALQYLTLPDAAALGFLVPLSTCVAARLFLGEKYYYQQALASLVSLAGVVLIARPTALFGENAHGSASETATPAERASAVLACLVSVVGATFVMILLKRIGEKAHALASVSNYAVLSVVGSTIALVFFRPAKGLEIPRSWSTWGILFLTGIFGFMLQFLTSKAIQIEQATVLSNLKYTQILYAVTFEFLIWHDLPPIWSAFGIVLVLSGVIWSARYKAKRTLQDKVEAKPASA